MSRLSPETVQALQRDLFACTGEHDPHRHAMARAELLDDLVQQVYDHVKQWVPGGGLDGRDSDERESVGHVLGAARDHLDETLRVSTPTNVTPLRPSDSYLSTETTLDPATGERSDPFETIHPTAPK